jgi:membrane protein DedA with SNARE-associated domain
MLELVDSWLRAVGPLGYLVLALAALTEYLFPPFPGDTVALLGGAYAASGERSLILVLVALTAGSVAGMAGTWRVGLALGARLSTWPPERRVLGVRVGALQQAQALMRQRGAWLLVTNRFLPSFRAMVFLAAGASGVRLSRALLFGTLSAFAWNTLLVGAGLVVGRNARRIDDFLATYRVVALAVVALVAAVLVARWALRRSRAR